MKSGKVSKLRFISVIIFIFGLVVASKAYLTHSRPDDDNNGEGKGHGFTVFFQQTSTPPGGGTPQVYAKKVRYQKADGEFRLITTYYNPDGTVILVEEVFATPEKGVFRKINDKLIFLSEYPRRFAPLTDATMEADPHFSRWENVMGHRMAVTRFEQDPNHWSEQYWAPTLQGMPIKFVTFSEGMVDNVEPTKIDMKEPSSEKFPPLPDSPVNYDKFKEKIKNAEGSGNHDMAEQMREQLDRQQQK